MLNLLYILYIIKHINGNPVKCNDSYFWIVEIMVIFVFLLRNFSNSTINICLQL